MTRTMNGTGSFSFEYDPDNKRIRLDVSGMRDGDCYRNDPSVFLLLGNAYAETSRLLLKEINECFISNNNHRLTIKYVIPFMFNARHSFECKIKAYIISLSNESAPVHHKITNLIMQFEQLLLSIDYSLVDAKYVKLEDYNDGIDKINNILLTLESNVRRFLSDAKYDQYYRFLFNKQYEIVQPIIDFDLVKYENLFVEINAELFEIEKMLHCIGFHMFSV